MGKINIRLSKGDLQEQQNQPITKETSFSPDGGYQASQNNGAINRMRRGALSGVIMQSANRALDYGLSNYGVLTGDHFQQEKTQGFLEVAGLVGLAFTGVAGTIYAGLTVGTKALNRNLEIRESRATSRVLQQRMGLANGDSRW